MLDAIEQLRTKQVEIAYPYDGICHETSEIIRNLFIKRGRIGYLTKNRDKMKPLYLPSNMKGGGIFVNKQK